MLRSWKEYEGVRTLRVTVPWIRLFFSKYDLLLQPLRANINHGTNQTVRKQRTLSTIQVQRCAVIDRSLIIGLHLLEAHA
jgi:hypothetical protein